MVHLSGHSSENSSWDAGPGRPAVRPLRLRAARTGLFIVAGGASFAMIDYKHSAPPELGRLLAGARQLFLSRPDVTRKS